MTSVTDAAGNQQVVDYDIYNRSKSTWFIPYGGTAENNYTEEYDQWGRVTDRKGYPDGIANPAIQESYQYDLVGNLTKVTDARGNDTYFVYDALNRINRVINPLGETIDCDYDRLGNLVTLNQYEGSNTFTTTKIYDERGLLTTSQPPEGNPTTFKYNSLGLPVEVSDAAGKVTTLLYDNSNNLIQKDVNQEQLKYYYNPLGGVDKCEVYSNGTPDEHLNYDYYSTGLTSERSVGSFTTQFEYDLVGNRTEVTDPFGYAVNYQYDTLHRLDNITAGNITFAYEYYADGMISAVNYPVTAGGSLRTEMTYDNLNRLTELQNILNGSTISQFNYVYDNNGNITAITENGTTTNYTYDSLNRLTGITRPNGEYIQYQYDTRGNRVQGAGITLKEEDFIPAEFGYNDWEELTSFTNTDTSETYTYQYDAEGLRKKKISPTETTRYHYDNNGRVIAESNATDQVTAQNIWGHKILGRKIGTAYYYYLYNGHGDVVQIVNEAGTIVNSYAYDEWGNIRSITETISNPIRYAGEYFDEESGLYYLRARYYDPVIARFITKDSYEGDISNPLSINSYAYCYNNPLIYADPSGHVVDYASEAARMNISQTGAWKDTVDQRLTSIGVNYMGGITDLDQIVGILQTVPTTNGNNSSNEAIASQQSPKSNNNPDPVSSATKPTTAAQEAKIVENATQPSYGYEGYSINPHYGMGTIISLADKNAQQNREAARSGAFDTIWYGAEGVIQKAAELIGKKIPSFVGTTVSGIVTGFDVNATLNNKNYTTGQKATKIAIQIGGGMICVGVGTPIAEAAGAAAPFTGGISIAGGAVAIGYLAYNVNRLQNYLYNKLGID